MKLTAAEKKWIKKVQKALSECPSKRLGFYTIGDPDIEIYDATKEYEIGKLMDEARSMDFCNAVDKLNARSGESFIFPNPVHSTAG